MKVLKRLSALLIVLILAFSSLQLLAFAENEKPISTYQDLCDISKDLNGKYYLTGDITVSGKKLTPMGTALSQFKGVLDGRGYSIIGLEIGSSKSENGKSNYSGIFTYNGGTIKNLNLVNVKVVGGNANYAYAGAFAAINLGVIENCYVSGSITNNDVTVSSYTGSFSGQMLRGNIEKCVSYANVFAKGSQQYTGGITGYNERGGIKECAMFGSVFANGVDASTDVYCGGITGFSRDEAEFQNILFGGGIIAEKFANVYLGGVLGNTLGKADGCVVTGTVTPSETLSHIYIGGIAGNDYGATINNAYFLEGFTNEDITCKTGTELTKSGMSNTAALSGIDFSSVWQIVDGKPMLKNIPTVNVDAISTLKGIKIVSKPKKLQYVQGYPALDLTGLKVNAIYSDKEVGLNQNEYTVSGYNYVKKGKQTITVTYKGFTDSFTINVTKTESGIIVPEITEDSYFEGNSTGGKETTGTKKPSTSSKTESEETQSRNEINTVIDELDEDEGSSDKDEEGTGSVTTIGGADKPTDVEVEIKPKKISTLVIIVIAVIVIGAVATFIVLYVKRKTAKENNKPKQTEQTEETKETE